MLLLAAAGASAGFLGALVFRRWHTCPLWSAALTGLLWTTGGPVSMAVAWFGVLLAQIDLRHHRLPDVLTLPLYPTIALLTAGEWPKALAGLALFGGAHLVVHRLSPRAMGGGDVKLAGALGAVLATTSWTALAAAAPLACVITLGVAAATRTRDVPHGPGLLAVTWGLSVL